MSKDLWLAAGLRTAFAKVDGPFGGRDAIAVANVNLAYCVFKKAIILSRTFLSGTLKVIFEPGIMDEGPAK